MTSVAPANSRCESRAFGKVPNGVSRNVGRRAPAPSRPPPAPSKAAPREAPVHFYPASLVLQRYVRSCPNGAKDRSHGWRPPQADGTRGYVVVHNVSAPEGRRKSLVWKSLPKRRARAFLRPSGAGRQEHARFHGFRGAGLRPRDAPPAATVLGPSGAGGPLRPSTKLLIAL